MILKAKKCFSIDRNIHMFHEVAVYRSGTKIGKNLFDQGK